MYKHKKITNKYEKEAINIENNVRKDIVFLQKDPYFAHVVPENGATQSVIEHLVGTKELAEKNCPLKILRNIVILEALLHDAGKVSEEFFAYMDDILKNGEKAKKRNVDHTSAGGRILEDLIGKGPLFEFISMAVYSHHGLQDGID